MLQQLKEKEDNAKINVLRCNLYFKETVLQNKVKTRLSFISEISCKVSLNCFPETEASSIQIIYCFLSAASTIKVI